MERLSRVRYAKASRDLGSEMPQSSMTGTMGSYWERRGMKLPSYSGTATEGSMFEKIRLLSRCKNRTLSPYIIIGDYERFFSLGSS